MTFHYSSDEIFCKDCVQAVTEYLVRFKDPLESECAEVERDLGVIWNCLCSLCRSFSFNILSEIIGLGMCWSWSWSGGRWNSELYADFSTSLVFQFNLNSSFAINFVLPQYFQFGEFPWNRHIALLFSCRMVKLPLGQNRCTCEKWEDIKNWHQAKKF